MIIIEIKNDGSNKKYSRNSHECCQEEQKPDLFSPTPSGDQNIASIGYVFYLMKQ